ncbi:OmpA family protein [Zeaxanthinibacter sp. PT1]|uniref:OmpA family protein n=1 Tax=Zeaxanthinibacter TaxID=561554 RepID=UPI0023495C54|nr:OmpA family protein [Zeaxanthinibacter sp. PT1]MDC6351419.1 OmpA family protein [Zeaxanthinibacter sp. PT1]
MMKLPALLLCSALLCVHSFYGQKKKDLILKVDELQTELDSTSRLLRECQRKESAQRAVITDYEQQLADSRKTNSDLLNTLTRVTEESKSQTENIGKSLENLNRKENQLRQINETLTSTDSTTIQLLTSIKKSLGDEVPIALDKNVFTIALDNSSLYGSAPQQYTIVESGNGILEKVAQIMKLHPKARLYIESNPAPALATDKKALSGSQLSALRASAVKQYLQENSAISPEFMIATGQGQGPANKTLLRITPDYDQFFEMVKELMKNTR